MPIDDNNPYAPPQTEVEKTDFSQQTLNDALAGFERMSIWLLLLLALVTLGLYLLVWLYKHTKLVNRKIPYHPISMSFVHFVLVFYFLSFFMSVGFSTMAYGNLNIMFMIDMLGFLSGILVLVWNFMLRNRFNTLFTSEFDQRFRFRIIWTFLFTVFYFQYKINCIHSEIEVKAG